MSLQLQTQAGYSGTLPVVIPNAGTTSPALALGGLSLVGLMTPAALTGVAFTFLVSDALAGTYVPMKDLEGAALSITVAAAQYYPIDPALFAGVQFLKIVSGATEGGARTIICSLK